jgi:hypothetical protein
VGNHLTRTNRVNKNFNEQYSYDNFNQLISFFRGNHCQNWPLDPLGNWNQFNTDLGNQRGKAGQKGTGQKVLSSLMIEPET